MTLLRETSRLDFSMMVSWLRRVLPPGVRRVLGDAVAVAEPLDAALRLALRDRPCPPIGLAMVYRVRNLASVRQLLAQAERTTSIALWALDDVPEELAGVTVGRGPGLRLELLNRAAASLHLPDDAWLILSDDDVVLRAGNLSDAVRLALLAGFDVTQPSHARGSPNSWAVNRHEPLMWARQTRFVETGPLLIFSPRARSACVPLKEELGMGWGSEAIWGTQMQLSTGVLDGVTMVHLGPVGVAYDSEAQQRQAEEIYAGLLPPAGFATLQDFQAVTGRWPVWRSRPPWKLSTSV